MARLDGASAYAIMTPCANEVPRPGFRFDKRARKALDKIRRGGWRKLGWDEWQAIAKGAGYRQARTTGGSQQLWLWEAAAVGLSPFALTGPELGRVLTLHPHAPHGSRSEAWPVATALLMSAVAIIHGHMPAEARLDEALAQRFQRARLVGLG